MCGCDHGSALRARGIRLATKRIELKRNPLAKHPLLAPTLDGVVVTTGGVLRAQAGSKASHIVNLDPESHCLNIWSHSLDTLYLRQPTFTPHPTQRRTDVCKEVVGRGGEVLGRWAVEWRGGGKLGVEKLPLVQPPLQRPDHVRQFPTRARTCVVGRGLRFGVGRQGWKLGLGFEIRGVGWDWHRHRSFRDT